MGKGQVICWILILIAILWTENTLAKKGSKSKTGGGWGNNNNNRNTGGTWTHWNSGTNWNSGGSHGQNYNPQGGGSNFNKQWKPPKNKPNMKMVAGAAAAGALAGGVGGYMLGSAMGRMRYNFGNSDDDYYYNQNYGRMPNQVYRPRYIDNQPVTEDRFVTDCYNMSATEYIYKYQEGKNATDVDPVEVRVKSQVITQMCKTEYRKGGNFRMDDYGNGSGVKFLFSYPLLITLVSLLLYFVVQ